MPDDTAPAHPDAAQKAEVGPEADAWRRAVRVLHHEIANSLSPVLSLARTGRALLARDGGDERLDAALATIAERVQHLCTFVAGYAAVARLPAPERRSTAWRPLLEGLAGLIPFQAAVEPEDFASEVDRAQVEQLILNLVKNAAEAGSPPDAITVRVEGGPHGARVFVSDRGRGMDDETLARAPEPFFTTKRGGSGLGLALAREIAGGHGGTLALRRRPHGGLEIELLFPAVGAAGADRNASALGDRDPRPLQRERHGSRDAARREAEPLRHASSVCIRRPAALAERPCRPRRHADEEESRGEAGERREIEAAWRDHPRSSR